MRDSSVPGGWEPRDLQGAADLNPESLGAGTPPDYRFRYIDLTSVKDGSIDWSGVTEQVFRSAPSRARRVVRRGDVLFGTVRPALRSHGIVKTDDSALVASTGFAVIRARPGGGDPGFLFHFILGAEAARQARQREVGSNYPAVNETDVRRFRLICPPLREQRRISEILDTLDEAIRKTEQVIAKLQQVRQGLLHDLLMRGIDENGEVRDPARHPKQFRDSPLGRIPAQWAVGVLNDAVDPRRPVVYGILMPGRGHPGGVPVIKVRDIIDGRINTDDLLLTNPAIDYEYRRSRLEGGDLLFTIRGTVGKMAFVPPQLSGANITQDTARLSITQAHAPFVRQYLDMPIPRRFVEAHTIGQAVKGLNLRDVRRIPVALPPVAEQREVARRLASIDSSVVTEGRALGKLRVLKLGVRDDLLTGRVRVEVPAEANP
jgi:type I restriction enzyme S subunit